MSLTIIDYSQSGHTFSKKVCLFKNSFFSGAKEKTRRKISYSQKKLARNSRHFIYTHPCTHPSCTHNSRANKSFCFCKLRARARENRKREREILFFVSVCVCLCVFECLCVKRSLVIQRWKEVRQFEIRR